MLLKFLEKINRSLMELIAWFCLFAGFIIAWCVPHLLDCSSQQGAIADLCKDGSNVFFWTFGIAWFAISFIIQLIVFPPLRILFTIDERIDNVAKRYGEYELELNQFEIFDEEKGLDDFAACEPFEKSEYEKSACTNEKKKMSDVVSRKCVKCGTMLTVGANFCSNCGAVIPRRCLKCGNVLAAEAFFCPACGQSCTKFGNNDDKEKKDVQTTKIANIKNPLKLDTFARENENTSHVFAIFFVLMLIGLIVGCIVYFNEKEDRAASEYASNILTTYRYLQDEFFLANHRPGYSYEIGLFIEESPDYKILDNQSLFSITSQRNIRGCPQYTVWEIRNEITKDYKKVETKYGYQHQFYWNIHYDCALIVKTNIEHPEAKKNCEKLIPDFKTICGETAVRPN